MQTKRLPTGTAKPLLAEDIGVAAFPTVPYESPLRSLCKPAFSNHESSDTGMFVCGTEDTSPEGLANNRLVFGKINFTSRGTRVLPSGKPAIWAHPVHANVRDVQWLSRSYVIAAVNDRLALVRVSGADVLEVTCETLLMPAQHTDVIREIAVNPATPSLVLSGGYDGSVIVTDLAKVLFLTS